MTRLSTQLLLAGVVLTTALGGCSDQKTTEAPQPQGSAPISSTAQGQFTLPPVAPITPTSANTEPTGVPPAVAPPQVDGALFTDPLRVTTAWMRQFCQTDFMEPINGNLTRAATYATLEATAADTTHGDTAQSYQQMQNQKLATRCDQVEASINPEAPTTPSMVYVQVSAARTQLADGRPFQTLPLVSTRRVVRGGDGRWLVDAAVDAG
ncbi:hypothetical protein [Amycolatopsis sp. WAC 01375]|uniref:hypothetical protein n=1 Tax=Amycolatopsis sp. WAC 01375 TaxID=2203194 RepID=UPI0018F5AF58|nr:hypothetical protein [Amycolatopsis sp. WAC 01375]